LKLALALLTLLFTVEAASAQVVFRCGSVYSQKPCPHGKVVEATDPRSAAQRAEAQRVSASERKLAADMRNDRLAEERALKPATAGSLSAARPASVKPESRSDRSNKKKKQKRSGVATAASEDFVASGPSTKKKRAGP
jgi:hypothetical protein